MYQTDTKKIRFGQFFAAKNFRPGRRQNLNRYIIRVYTSQVTMETSQSLEQIQNSIKSEQGAANNPAKEKELQRLMSLASEEQKRVAELPEVVRQKNEAFVAQKLERDLDAVRKKFDNSQSEVFEDNDQDEDQDQTQDSDPLIPEFIFAIVGRRARVLAIVLTAILFVIVFVALAKFAAQMARKEALVNHGAKKTFA